MLRILINKQYKELFQGYYVNRKNGKARSKFATRALYVLFTVLMLILAAIFLGISYLMCKPLFQIGVGWLYYSVMGIMAIGLGTFGSVFNTYAGLFKAKDNEMLISLPIPPQTILLSRVMGVIGMSLLYSGIVWIPAVIGACIWGNVNASSIICGCVLTIMITLFITVISCALGWVVALISGKLKNKSYATVLISLVFFAAYYFVSMKLTDFIRMIVENAAQIGNALEKWGNVFYLLGKAASGEWLHMILFCGITIGMAIICYLVLKKTFLYITTKSEVGKKVEYKEKNVKMTGMKKALFHREWKRFYSSPTYMLNCGLGIVLMPLLIVAVIWKKDYITTLITLIVNGQAEFLNLIPLAVALVVCMIASLNTISTPSISLEGKHLWILKSLPIAPKDLLEAKLNFHGFLNSIPAVITTGAIGFVLNRSPYEILLMCIFTGVFVWFSGAIGLVIGLKRPNFTWVSETTVVKQSLNVLIVWLFNWVVLAAVGVAGYFLRNMVDYDRLLLIMIVVLSLVFSYLKRWLFTRGEVVFRKL